MALEIEHNPEAASAWPIFDLTDPSFKGVVRLSEQNTFSSAKASVKSPTCKEK